MKMTTEPDIVWIPPAELRRRVDTIPLPTRVKSAFVNVFKRWQASSGTEWTTVRLKSFKDCLLNSYAEGGREISHKPQWFRTTASGKLHGVFGDLWVIAMQSSANLKAVLMLVNIYTAAGRTEWNTEIIDDITSSIERQGVSLANANLHPSLKPTPNIARRALQRLGWYKAVAVMAKPTPITWQLPAKESHVNRLVNDTFSLSGLPLLEDDVLQLIREAAGSVVSIGGNVDYLTEVGDIHMTHEPGLKTRYFAAPNVILQQAMEPMKRTLLGFLAKVPWDCTLQQRKADEAIQSALNQGRTVHSVDLSKATDAFPWEWQRAVLQNLFRGGEARAGLALFRTIVEMGYWNLPDGSQVRFKAGQPLGLGPSFPAFTLSHGLLLFYLNGYKWDEKFYVLGDDVIIFDDHLASKYREVLRGWKVDVSEAKSFSSARIAQFAGVTYTSTGSFWVPKWRAITARTILDLAAWWYPGLTEGFKDSFIIERILALPAPYGIGRNPQGLPLDQRMPDDLSLALAEREHRRALKEKPSVTRSDTRRLVDILRKKGTNEHTIYLLQQMADASSELANQTVRWNLRHRPTGLSLHPYLVALAHGTEMGGYPRLRLKPDGVVDPYTLGNLNSWKRVFRKLDAKALPSEPA